MGNVLVILAGFAADLLIGDPEGWPHIVRLIGTLAEKLEIRLRAVSSKNEKGELAAGRELVLFTLIITAFFSVSVLLAARIINICLYYIISVIIVWQVLALRSLEKESSAVLFELEKDDISEARIKLSRIVGRDTQKLSREEIVKATVETVAENTSDAVIAPLFWLFLLGPAGGLIFKAVSTLDSMFGYDNEKYRFLGRAAARADDMANWLPSRISAVFMIVAAFFVKGCDAKNAFFIWKRDRMKHKSPNAGQTESVCAGALNIKLGGDASYFGVMTQKAELGDAGRKAEATDIVKSQRLMFVSSFLSLAVFSAIASAAVIFLSP